MAQYNLEIAPGYFIKESSMHELLRQIMNVPEPKEMTVERFKDIFDRFADYRIK